MTETMTHGYGHSTDLFVNRKRSGESLVVGGIGQDQARWTRVLSHRAAQMLWYHLTQHLFPEKCDVVTALATTAPLRNDTMPTITTHVQVEYQNNSCYDIVGWVGGETWWVRLNEPEARRFWAVLDMALFPVGWQGSRH
jgi:hypothetical protein